MFEWANGNTTYLVDKTKVAYFVRKDSDVFFKIGETELRTPFTWDQVKSELQAHSQA